MCVICFSICCLCCPTIFRNLHKNSPKESEVYLFDVDEDKCTQFDKFYQVYDFNRPREMNDSFKNLFDIVVADTPHFTEICVRKIIMTIQHVMNSDCKIIFCTTKGMLPEFFNFQCFKFCKNCSIS